MKEEARDRMVARVKEAHDKYPTLADVPEGTEGGDFSVEVGSDEAGYVRALHEIGARGVLVGRRAGDEKVLIGKLDAPAKAPEGDNGGLTIRDAAGNVKK